MWSSNAVRRVTECAAQAMDAAPRAKGTSMCMDWVVKRLYRAVAAGGEGARGGLTRARQFVWHGCKVALIVGTLRVGDAPPAVESLTSRYLIWRLHGGERALPCHREERASHHAPALLRLCLCGQRWWMNGPYRESSHTARRASQTSCEWREGNGIRSS